MKNIWLLTKTNMKRNVIGIFIAILGAVVLCFVLNAMGNMVADLSLSKIKVGVIDEDNSKLSADFKEYLTDHLNYELIENKSFDLLSTELIDKNISVIIEIPENFHNEFSKGNKMELIITSLDDYENAAFIQAYINNYLSSIQVLSYSAGGTEEVFSKLLEDYKKEEITLTQTSAQSMDKLRIAQREGFINSIGFFLMFIFGVSIILAFMILDDRLSGVLNRVQITPVKPVHYIIGSGIFGLLISLLTVAIYCGYIYIMDIQVGVPLWLLILVMSLFSLFTLCFTMAVALAFKTKNAIVSVIIGFSTLGNILGGAYFPLELSPKSLQSIARILPQYWFMDAFRAIQINPVANIQPHIIILTLFTVLSFLIGAVLFSQSYKTS